MRSIIYDYLFTSEWIIFYQKMFVEFYSVRYLKTCLFPFSRKKVVRRVRRLNPLKNTRAMLRLNPYAAVLKRQAILSAQKRKLNRDAELAEKRGVSKHIL